MFSMKEGEIGAAIQRRTALPVDLGSPGLELRVEIDVEHAYVHVRELETAGGLPVGIQFAAAPLNAAHFLAYLGGMRGGRTCAAWL